MRLRPLDILRRWWRRRRPGQRRLLAAAVLAVPAAVVLLNLSVAFFGSTLVNPLSPLYLPQKGRALGRYFEHRWRCFFTRGHGDIRAAAQAAAQRHGVDRWLFAALVDVESGSRAHRISPAGAMGPAQLVASTAEMLRVRDPFDPEQGLDGGARYLAEMLRRFRGSETLAVAAYNAGPAAIVGGRVPRNGETEHYVVRVLQRWRELRPPPPRPAPPPPAPVATVPAVAPAKNPTPARATTQRGAGAKATAATKGGGPTGTGTAPAKPKATTPPAKAPSR